MHHPGIIDFHSGVHKRLISRRHQILLSLQLSWLPSFRLTHRIALGALMEKTLEILHHCNFFLTDCEIHGFLHLTWEGISSSGSCRSLHNRKQKMRLGWRNSSGKEEEKGEKKQMKMDEDRNTSAEKRDVIIRSRKECRLQKRKWETGWKKSKTDQILLVCST